MNLLLQVCQEDTDIHSVLPGFHHLKVDFFDELRIFLTILVMAFGLLRVVKVRVDRIQNRYDDEDGGRDVFLPIILAVFKLGDRSHQDWQYDGGQCKARVHLAVVHAHRARFDAIFGEAYAHCLYIHLGRIVPLAIFAKTRRNGTDRGRIR